MLFILIVLVIASSFGYALFSPFTIMEEEVDSDKDGIPDRTEIMIGLDPYKKNTVEDLIKISNQLDQMLLNGTISISDYRYMKRIINELILKMNKS